MHPEVKLADYAGQRLRLIWTHFSTPLESCEIPDSWERFRVLEAETPFHSNAPVGSAVRDFLRQSGYKPTGRGKPASEYLLRMGESGLRSINLAVDVCNIVSMHSGIPISVIDSERSQPDWSIHPADSESSYVFNPGGQTIKVGGLLCLHDPAGPCANAVKDAQRTKTTPETAQTLTIIWGCSTLADRVDLATEWYQQLLVEAGAHTVSGNFCP